MKASVKTKKPQDTLIVPVDVTNRMTSVCKEHNINVPDFIIGAIVSAIITFERHKVKKQRAKVTSKRATAKKPAIKKEAVKKTNVKKKAVKKAPAKKRSVGRPRKAK